MAIYVIMLVDGYFRPGELLSLQRGGLLPPTYATGSWTVLLFPQEQIRRSKTNQADDTVLMDGNRCPWMKHVYKVLSTGNPLEKIFPWKYPFLARTFGVAAKRIGVPVVPYQGRHSGASLDASRRLRPLLEVQKRGRWQTMKSVVRYEKGGRLAETWKTLSAAQKRHFELCESSLERIILHRRGLPPSLSA